MKQTYIVKVSTEGIVTREPFNAADSLKQLQTAVGGHLEIVPMPAIPSKEPYSICCFVDEEGRLKRRPVNPRISAFVCPVYVQPIVGDACFAAYDYMGETVGLTEADCAEIERDLANFGGSTQK